MRRSCSGSWNGGKNSLSEKWSRLDSGVNICHQTYRLLSVNEPGSLSQEPFVGYASAGWLLGTSPRLLICLACNCNDYRARAQPSALVWPQVTGFQAQAARRGAEGQETLAHALVCLHACVGALAARPRDRSRSKEQRRTLMRRSLSRRLPSCYTHVSGEGNVPPRCVRLLIHHTQSVPLIAQKLSFITSHCSELSLG